MEITISFNSIWIPIIITIICFTCATLYPDDKGYFSGLSNLMLLIPASIISMIAWITYAIVK